MLGGRLRQLRPMLSLFVGVLGFLPAPAQSQGFGGRYQEVGFEVNPFARGKLNTMSAMNQRPSFSRYVPCDMAQCTHMDSEDDKDVLLMCCPSLSCCLS
jgi:hypothetical protein